MNIPEATIEPFGETGIPVLKDMMNESKYTILNSVLKYREDVNNMKSFFDNQSIIVSTQIITTHHGAINPVCTHVVDTEDSRVFQLDFNVARYPRRITFGFNIFHR